MIKNKKFFLLTIWSVFIILGFLVFREFYNLNIQPFVGAQNIWESRRFLAFIVVAIIAILGSLFALRQILHPGRVSANNLLNKMPFWLKSFIALILILLPGLLKWFLPLPENFTYGFWMELFSIFVLALIVKTLLFNNESDLVVILRIGCIILLAGAGHAIFYRLAQVTTYPFTLYWSEGNRFFDYSTLFGSYRYIFASGEKIKAFTTWGMQLPWALPFIFPGITIGFFRVWYQLMWILPTVVLGWAAVYQVKSGKGTFFLTIVFAFWTFLFLEQGPIYAPLVIGAIFTVIAVRAKLIPGVIIIFIASYYTRNSRWTWSYAPGLWAGMMALLAIKKPTITKLGLKKLIKPLALGISGYLGGQLIPSIISNLNSSKGVALLPSVTTSTTRQPLLWDRLFPNPTYPSGILWALVWAVVPVILLLSILIIKRIWKTNWLQNLALVLIPGTFLVVGIIASVKIGGGSNLHNLDMFLISLVLIVFSALADLIQIENPKVTLSPILSLAIFVVLVSPVTFTMIGGERPVIPSYETISDAMNAIKTNVEQFSKQGEILFIDHRQLLTFGLVKNVPLVDDYEKKYLMDQAMAEKQDYFEKFYKDLTAKRFSLIVNEPSNLVFRGSEESFGEENDAFVKWVTIPILCTYEPIYTSPETSVELLVPRNTLAPESLHCDQFLASSN